MPETQKPLLIEKISMTNLSFTEQFLLTCMRVQSKRRSERMIRLAIRGFVSGEVQFEEQLTLFHDQAIEDVIPDLAKRHAVALIDHELHMIEIEFLDEPDQNERFFRLGTDPSGMVIPIGVKL